MENQLPTYSVWNEEVPATSIPSIVKELARSTKRPRSASQSSSSSSDNYPATSEAFSKPPMGPPLSKPRKAKAHFHRMKAAESPSAPVQYHPAPQSSSGDNRSGVVEAEVSPPKKTKGFSNRFMRNKPVVTKRELNDGLKSCSEEVRSATLRLYMLISSGNFTKDQVHQEEQKFLEAAYIYQIQETLRFKPVSNIVEFIQPPLPEILLALKSGSSMYRKRAINVYRAILSMEDMGDPHYKEALASFQRAKKNYLEAVRLVELGVLDVNQTILDQPKETAPQIIGTMTIGEDLWKALDCDDPHLKACASAYYEILSTGTSLGDPKLARVGKRFKDAVEAYSAKLKVQVEYMQTTKAQGQYLVQQLQECEDIQAGLSSKIQDLTLDH